MRNINLDQLALCITSKQITDADLSELDCDGLDFSGCKLHNVIFSKENQEDRTIKKCNFAGATLENVFFDHASLLECNFDGANTQLMRVSMKKSKLEKCRFRKTRFSWCDLRYAEIAFGTFEEAWLEYCDLYRTFFMGISIFRKSIIKDCSLYYTYFDEGSTIRRENLANGKILQQNKKKYLSFLADWPNLGPGIRKNDQGKQSDWNPTQSLRNRFADAEDIYKTLNGLWMSKGFLGDANWAYVNGKKMERNRLFMELLYNKGTNLFAKMVLMVKIVWNFICGQLFGYGESMFRMVLTYVVTVFLFAYFYYSSQVTHISDYAIAIGISFKNMVALTPDTIQNISPFVDFLNMIQTTIGILITGIFGFILGNKIRNQ
jgi:uncharacterized protein YjbI with pentapeptide repeats